METWLVVGWADGKDYSMEMSKESVTAVVTEAMRARSKAEKWAVLKDDEMAAS